PVSACSSASRIKATRRSASRTTLPAPWAATSRRTRSDRSPLGLFRCAAQRRSSAKRIPRRSKPRSIQTAAQYVSLKTALVQDEGAGGAAPTRVAAHDVFDSRVERLELQADEVQRDVDRAFIVVGLELAR